MTQGDSLPQSYIQGHDNTKPAKNTKTPKGLDKGTQYQKLQAIKLGDKVIYKQEQHTIVRKDGSYVTMADENQHLVTAHFTDTIQSNDIHADMWNMMQTEARNALLHKTKVPIEFGTRSWYELPSVLKAFLNRSDVWETISKAPYTEVQVSGNAGREPGVTRDDESRSFRDSDPINAKQYDGKKDKSDVEHGAYGGVVTDTPFDAPEDYEEDKREGKRAQQQHERLDKPRNPKDSGYEVTIGYHTKENGIQNGNPEEVEKEGEGSGTVSTVTEGVNNPVYGGKKVKKNGITSEVKKTSRFGIRYNVTQEEFDAKQ